MKNVNKIVVRIQNVEVHLDSRFGVRSVPRVTQIRVRTAWEICDVGPTNNELCFQLPSSLSVNTS
jgi:hypothetical protein